MGSRHTSCFKDESLMHWLFDVPSQILRNGFDRWMDAKARQLIKVGRAPRIRNRINLSSVLISSELLRFIDEVHADDVVPDHRQLSTEKIAVEFMDFNAHNEYGMPMQIVMWRTGRKWWMSLIDEHAAPDGFVHRCVAELLYELNALDDDAH